jgi:phosphoribosyl-AMP cyclohydrolase / phosphoribosyl-ATP pyrophosphohydrolase
MKINFDKDNGLVPAIIQDADTGVILMLGYMNDEAFKRTEQEGKVTFYSRSKKKLWTKGETSGNWLYFKKALIDCDNDTLLIKAKAAGPTCHTGQDTCFNEINQTSSFLSELENVIQERKKAMPDNSYTTELFQKGINKISQKVGEEATEVIIEAMAGNNILLKEESADLLYHLMVLLAERDIRLEEVVDILAKRHKK